MFCTHCGASISDDAKFCPVCGSPVAGASAQPEPQPAPQLHQQPAASAVPQQTYAASQQTSQQAYTAQQPPQDFSYQNNSGVYAQQSPVQSYGGVPAGPVQSDRSLAMWILLSIVTCGIYSYYFLYCLARDVNVMCRDDGDSTPGLATLILLSIVTCGFYSFYWYYKLGNRLQLNAPRYGLQFQENGTSVLLWFLLGSWACGLGAFVGMNILIKNSNALASAYNAQYAMRA